MKKYILYYIFALAAMFALYSCSDDDKGYTPETINNPVTEITIADVTAEGIVLTDVGNTSTVTVQKAPADGGDADRFSFDYSSSNPKIFIVDSKGLITAVGAGKALLTVTAKNNAVLKASCDVTVVGTRITSLEFSQPTYLLTYGGPESVLDLSASVTIEPDSVSIKSLRYSSSDTNVATIDGVGIVTPVWEGTTTITAEAIDGSGKKATCELIVSIVPVSSILFNAFTFNLQSNAIASASTAGTLHVNTIRNLLNNTECSPNIPINKTSSSYTSNSLRYAPLYPTLTTFKYTSSDPTIVGAESDVNNQLIVKPLSKPGTAVITIEATDEHGAKAELTIVNHAVYSREKWKIVDSAPNGTNHLGEGGPVENVISDNDVTAGLMKSDPYKNDQSVSVTESFFVVDLGAETKFDYMLTEAIWSTNNNASRPRQISLYGSNSFPTGTWTPIQENININHGSYYIVPTMLTQTYSYSYRYVKAVIWSSTAGTTNTANKDYAYYLIKNFWLGSSE